MDYNSIYIIHSILLLWVFDTNNREWEPVNQIHRPLNGTWISFNHTECQTVAGAINLSAAKFTAADQWNSFDAIFGME